MSFSYPMSSSLLNGLLGGSVIGLSAASLLLLTGDVLGASGIINRVVLSPIQTLSDSTQHWKLVLMASFALTARVFFKDSYDKENIPQQGLTVLATALAGLFVGFGTKLGNGCTSGHGICGLARFSKRSLVAVLTFMGTAMATTFLTMPDSPVSTFEFLRAPPSQPSFFLQAGSVVTMGLSTLALFSLFGKKSKDENSKAKLGPAAISGSLFAAGLYFSQMVYRSKVWGFLDVSKIPSGTWDATLMMVMGGGLAVSFAAYQFLEHFRVVKHTKPLEGPVALRRGSKFSVPTNTVIDSDLVVGAACFGVGWGLGGLCPGPALFMAALGETATLTAWWPGYIVGAYAAQQYKRI